jgi:hypothetical protein
MLIEYNVYLFQRGQAMSETSNIKRVGSAEVISKNGDDLWVRIRLSATPNAEWLQRFRDPISCQTNKTHPSNARLNSDNTLDFESTMGGLENDIKWMDKYIEQANAACIAKKAKELSDRKRKEELEAKKIEELKKINESIKDI